MINKKRHITRNIRKPGIVGNLNIITFTQKSNDLISRSFEIPASAYYHPLCTHIMRAIPNIITLILLSTLTVFSQDFKKVDETVKSYPDSFNKLEKLADLISKDFKTPEEKSRAIYTWIALNVTYGLDSKKLKNRYTYKTQEEKKEKEQKFREDLALKTLKDKKAVCEGYATLFKVLCDLTSVECQIIRGTSKTKDIDIGKIPKNTNHSWNAVLINGEWKLIDATWGAGYIDTDRGNFVQDFTDLYFFTDPQIFFLKHYPKNTDWLLIKKTDKEFAKLPLYYHDYFNSEIEIIKPVNGIIKVRNDKSIQVVMKNSRYETVSFKFNNEKKSQKIEPKIDGELCYYEIKPSNGMYLTIYVNYNAFIAYKLERK